MAVEQSQKFCKTCKAKRMVQRKGTNHILHLLLSVVTCGAWIVVWLLACVRIGGWRCSQCGAKC
jgi:hypothetical protein